MSEFTDRLKKELKDFFPDVMRGVRDDYSSEKQELLIKEREDNIAIAAMAMVDAGLSDDVVIEKLNKFWDLRRSESKTILEWAHKRLDEDDF